MGRNSGRASAVGLSTASEASSFCKALGWGLVVMLLRGSRVAAGLSNVRREVTPPKALDSLAASLAAHTFTTGGGAGGGNAALVSVDLSVSPLSSAAVGQWALAKPEPWLEMVPDALQDADLSIRALIGLSVM